MVAGLDAESPLETPRGPFCSEGFLDGGLDLLLEDLLDAVLCVGDAVGCAEGGGASFDPLVATGGGLSLGWA